MRLHDRLVESLDSDLYRLVVFLELEDLVEGLVVSVYGVVDDFAVQGDFSEVHYGVDDLVLSNAFLSEVTLSELVLQVVCVVSVVSVVGSVEVAYELH